MRMGRILFLASLLFASMGLSLGAAASPEKNASRWIKNVCENAFRKTQGLVILGRIRMDFTSRSADAMRFGFACLKKDPQGRLFTPHLEYVLGKNRSIPLDVAHFTFEAWPEKPRPGLQARPRYFLAMSSVTGEQLLYRLVLDPRSALSPQLPMTDVGLVDEERESEAPGKSARPYAWIMHSSGFSFRMGQLLREQLCKIKIPLTENYDECVQSDNLWFPTELSVVYQKQTRYFSAFSVFRRLALNEVEYPQGQVCCMKESADSATRDNLPGIQSKLAYFEALTKSFAHPAEKIRELKELLEAKLPAGELK